jgi:hypothetical protein
LTAAVGGLPLRFAKLLQLGLRPKGAANRRDWPAVAVRRARARQLVNLERVNNALDRHGAADFDAKKPSARASVGQ